MRRELIFGPLLLVYQMPKTGSQTAEATLERCGLPHRIIRLHFMSRKLSARVARALKSPLARGDWEKHTRDQLGCAKELRCALRWRRWLKRLGARIPKVEAVCAVREPISLALAAVFENHRVLFRELGEASLAACRKEMLKPRDHLFVHHWFNLELKPRLGINVYRKPFPRDRGYAIYENHFARVLVYRFEALKQLPVLLGEFLGREVKSVVTRNLGDAKAYGPAYRQVKQELRLPAEYVRGQCQCRLMQHFYSEEERRQFEAHWSEAALKGQPVS